jgi:hypothetical protein
MKLWYDEAIGIENNSHPPKLFRAKATVVGFSLNATLPFKSPSHALKIQHLDSL